MSEPSFGAFAPGPLTLLARWLANRTPGGRLWRPLRSVLRRVGGSTGQQTYDLALFSSQRARVRPVGNLCEKRVFMSDRHWEVEERSQIATFCARLAGEDLMFLDVGANVGLYTLAARAAARAHGLGFRGIAIEPQPELLQRLAFNLAASGATGEVAVFPWAATGEAGEVRLDIYPLNHGQTSISDRGSLAVPGRPVLDALTAAGWDRVDILKIDIEGAEVPALTAFFRDAPEPLWPALVLIEKESGPRQSGARLVERHGYECVDTTRMNMVLVRRVPPAGVPHPFRSAARA
jgi:FkbM family methyltransferase